MEFAARSQGTTAQVWQGYGRVVVRDEKLPGQLTPKLRADTLGHSWWYFSNFCRSVEL